MSIKMDYPFQVERGWPYGGALDSNETVATGSTLVAGDVVEIQTSGAIDVCGAAAAGLSNVGFVVRGNGDSTSVAASGDRAVVVWGGFIARTQKVLNTAYQPGDELQANAGILEPVGTATVTGATVAFVKEVHPAADGDPISLTIVVK